MSTLDRYLDDLGENVDGDTLLTRFLEYASDQGLELYPAQGPGSRWLRWPPTFVRSRSENARFTQRRSRRW
jgi:hypothetical protein